jgi:hypothetical protein
MNRLDLQEMYLNYLKVEGYVPELDEDGDISFKYEGKHLYINVDEDDQEYFRIMFPNFWSIESPEERSKAYKAASFTTGAVKVAKTYVANDNMIIAAEVFLKDPSDFKGLFHRLLNTITRSLATFQEKMRSEEDESREYDED